MPTRLTRHDEPGNIHFLTISCYRRLPFFRSPQARGVVLDCMDRARNRMGFRWLGYVIMPEHVHWLIYPLPRDQSSGSSSPGETNSTTLIPISKILESLKTSIARHVKSHLRRVWAEAQSLGNRGLDAWATSARVEKPIWTTRGIDFNIRTEQRPWQKLDYCHANPVTRGLVDRAELWRWSSYAYHTHGDATALSMDWNGEWPIE